MSIADQASVQGRVSVRPWRFALLVDIDSPKDVDSAFRLLTSVWGGIYMPIFDTKATPDETRHRAEWLGVDSIYCETPPEELTALTHEAGFAWRGTGQFGPFRVSESLTTGLLRSDQLSGAFDGLVIPSWAETTRMRSTSPRSGGHHWPPISSRMATQCRRTLCRPRV